MHAAGTVRRECSSRTDVRQDRGHTRDTTVADARSVMLRAVIPSSHNFRDLKRAVPSAPTSTSPLRRALLTKRVRPPHEVLYKLRRENPQNTPMCAGPWSLRCQVRRRVVVLCPCKAPPSTFTANVYNSTPKTPDRRTYGCGYLSHRFRRRHRRSLLGTNEVGRHRRAPRAQIQNTGQTGAVTAVAPTLCCPVCCVSTN